MVWYPKTSDDGRKLKASANFDDVDMSDGDIVLGNFTIPGSREEEFFNDIASLQGKTISEALGVLQFAYSANDSSGSGGKPN